MQWFRQKSAAGRIWNFKDWGKTLSAHILNKIRVFAVCTLAEQDSAPQFFFFGNDAPLCIVFFSLLHQEKGGKMALQMPFKKEQKVLETTNALLAKLQICSYEIVFLNKKVYILVYFFELLIIYTGSLVPADFSDAVFTLYIFKN